MAHSARKSLSRPFLYEAEHRVFIDLHPPNRHGVVGARFHQSGREGGRKGGP